MQPSETKVGSSEGNHNQRNVGNTEAIAIKTKPSTTISGNNDGHNYNELSSSRSQTMKMLTKQ